MSKASITAQFLSIGSVLLSGPLRVTSLQEGADGEVIVNGGKAMFSPNQLVDIDLAVYDDPAGTRTSQPMTATKNEEAKPAPTRNRFARMSTEIVFGNGNKDAQEFLLVPIDADRCLPKVREGEPIFVLRGQDQSAVSTLLHWQQVNREHLARVDSPKREWIDSDIKRFLDWRHANPQFVKRPD